MRPFSIVRLPTLSDTQARVAGDPDRRVLRAGGIDLLDRMKQGRDAPDQLVELSGLGDEFGARMRGVQSPGKGEHWRLGALVTLTQLEAFDDLPSGYAALRMAAGSAATPGIRNTATLGGNLLQRPRCWYYRNSELDCYKTGGGGCLAEHGRSRYHAIFGGGPSYIVHPSTLAVSLLCLDAEVEIAGAKGVRTQPLRELFVLPAVSPEREHTLEAGEVLLSVTLPKPAPSQRSTYVAAKERLTQDWPLVEAAVSLTVDGGLITQARVVLGHVAPVPWRVSAAEKLLVGNKPTAALFATVAEAALAGAKPLQDNAYKIPLAQGVVRTALHNAGGVPLPA